MEDMADSTLKVYTCTGFAWLGDEALGIIVATSEADAREQLAASLRGMGVRLEASDDLELLEMTPGVQLFNV